jgi:hypothetical protein
MGLEIDGIMARMEIFNLFVVALLLGFEATQVPRFLSYKN